MCTGIGVERPHVVGHRKQIDDVVLPAVAHLHIGNIERLCLDIGVVAFDFEGKDPSKAPRLEGRRREGLLVGISAGPVVVIRARQDGVLCNCLSIRGAPAFVFGSGVDQLQILRFVGSAGPALFIGWHAVHADKDAGLQNIGARPSPAPQAAVSAVWIEGGDVLDVVGVIGADAEDVLLTRLDVDIEPNAVRGCAVRANRQIDERKNSVAGRRIGTDLLHLADAKDLILWRVAL